MKLLLYIFFTLYASDKNPNFKHKIRNSQCSKSSKNNKNSKKNVIILFYKSFLFYKLSLFFIHPLFSFPFINIQILKMRFETRDVQSRVKRVKIENLKTIIFF